MADTLKHRIGLMRPGRHSLPEGLRFVGLVDPEGREIIRIRFSLDADKQMDFPLSAETLADLVQILGSLHPSTAEELPEGIADLRAKGAVQKK